MKDEYEEIITNKKPPVYTLSAIFDIGAFLPCAEDFYDND